MPRRPIAFTAGAVTGAVAILVPALEKGADLAGPRLYALLGEALAAALVGGLVVALLFGRARDKRA